jgi:transposase
MVLTEIQKYEILIKHEAGLSNLQIANNMKINKNTVNLWITRHKKFGNLKRKRGSGIYKKNDNI